MHGTMRVMDMTGHSSITWDPEVPVEVATAKAAFENLIKQGYQAFEVEGGDQRGSRMREFDPEAGKIIMVPQLVGG